MNEIWLSINERVKFLFDSLRNLGISIGVLKAGQYLTSIIPNQSTTQNPELLVYIGYSLIFISSIYFLVGCFHYFPNAKTLGLKTRVTPYAIQIYLVIVYMVILYGLYVFEINNF